MKPAHGLFGQETESSLSPGHPDRLTSRATRTRRAIQPLTVRDSLRIMVAFVCLYVAAASFDPSGNLHPAVQTSNSSGLSGAINHALDSSVTDLLPPPLKNAYCKPDRKNLYPEQRYSTPIDKVRLRTQEPALPSGQRSC